MDTHEVEPESAEPDGFAVTVPAFPGLLILGTSLGEALASASLDRVPCACATPG